MRTKTAIAIVILSVAGAASAAPNPHAHQGKPVFAGTHSSSSWGKIVSKVKKVVRGEKPASVCR